MSHKNRIVKPARVKGTVLAEDGSALSIPDGWELLEPGDGPLTKVVKSKGPSWLVQVKMGRRLISKGIWTDKEHIIEGRREIDAKRSTVDYAKKRKTDLARKERLHNEYVATFSREVATFLSFAPRYKDLEEKLALAVTIHATPVGSGTVARTTRIPVEDRAAKAVVAWLRHQTTSYDRMTIARVKGRRREVRRELAGLSMTLLSRYRQGEDVSDSCPLMRALTT
ncbi:MAG: hypothetical protein ACI8ZB_000646 [Desulforhopalus sp.]|jgi:hypothetical protein